MSAMRNPGPNADEGDDLPEEQVPPTPDEDGPHDVPDEAVIEKTLPKGSSRKSSAANCRIAMPCS